MKTENLKTMKTRLFLNCLSSVLMAIASFIWAPKSMLISFALLGASGIYALAAKRSLDAVSPAYAKNQSGLKWDKDLFKN